MPPSHAQMARRAAAVAVAAMTIAATGALPAGATSDATIDRLAGVDRFATAADVSAATFDATTRAYVTTGLDFPDALAANGLAGTVPGPILLTAPDSLPASTAAELERLDVDEVVIIGGDMTVSPAVEATLAASYEVSRVAGVDRITTAVEIARAIDAEIGIGAVDGQRTALLARTDDFADALMAGPISYNLALPILLSPSGSLPASTSQALEELGIEQVIIVGGSSALSDAVESAVAATGATVRRVSGPTRQLTAAALADFAIEELGFSIDHVNIARGDVFADAVAGGAHAGDVEMAPIMLSARSNLGIAAREYLESRCDTLASIHVLGGTSAVSDATADEALTAARSC